MTTFASECGRVRVTFRNYLNNMGNFTKTCSRRAIEPKAGPGRRLAIATNRRRKGDMTIDRVLLFSMLVSAISAAGAGPALAQACTRQGTDVSCDDGRSEEHTA